MSGSKKELRALLTKAARTWLNNLQMDNNKQKIEQVTVNDNAKRVDVEKLKQSLADKKQNIDKPIRK